MNSSYNSYLIHVPFIRLLACFLQLETKRDFLIYINSEFYEKLLLNQRLIKLLAGEWLKYSK